MWLADEPRRIFAYTEPTDMRKSFQGLMALVQQIFRDNDPYSGDLFAFVNRRGNYIKILGWDRTGFVLFAKNLECDIRTSLRHTNEHPKPFIWTKSADQILASIRRFCQYTLKAHGKDCRTSDSGH